MAKSLHSPRRWLRRFWNPPRKPIRRQAEFRPHLEQLETRLAPSVTLASARFRSFANTPGNEIYVADHDTGVPPRAEAGYQWLSGPAGSPVAHDVVFTYDPIALTLSATASRAGGPTATATYTLPTALSGIDSLEVIVADRDTGSQVDFTNVFVDGYFLGDFKGQDNFSFTGYVSDLLNDGFTFTGTIWLSGPFSASAENSRVEIKVGQDFAERDKPANTPAACGCDCGEQSLIGDQTNSTGGDPASMGKSAAGTRASDGSVKVTGLSLGSSGFGTDYGYQAQWTNQAAFGNTSLASNPLARGGVGQVNAQLPYLVKDDAGNICLFAGSENVRFFDADGLGGYTPRFFFTDQLQVDGSDLVYTDTTGQRLRFFGFDTATPAGQRGQFRSLTDPAGHLTQVTATNPDGSIAEVQRSNGAGLTESYVYSYVSGGKNAGRLESVTLRRQLTSGGPWQNVRTITHTYYDGTQPFGNAGDLRTTSLLDENGQVIDVNYYRYYTAGDANGYEHGLKFFFDAASFARLQAAVADPFTAGDSQVADFATGHFQYDAQRRVVFANIQGQGCTVCTGGFGAFTYSYSTSANPDGFNSWRSKTVETLPDGNQNITYANSYGEVMLKVFRETATGREWLEFTEYDAQGRVVRQANPSAVSGYSESFADLLNAVGGNYQYLRDSAGLVYTTTYYVATTATESTAGGVLGYVQNSFVQRGELGTPIKQSEFTYFQRTAGGATVHPIASSTVYRNDDGTGAQTTSYAYTWFAGTTQVESLTTTLPVVTAAQNGPGVPDIVQAVYDVYGRLVYAKDGGGFISRFSYDPATGALVEVIEDVNTNLTADEPAGWVTPAGGGLHLVTALQVDALGRTVKSVAANGNITYTVYHDAAHEVRVYTGWDATTQRPTRPTWVYRIDRPGSYTETLTMSAAPTVDGTGRPTGQEAIANLESLSRTYVSAGGQVTHGDEYFNLAGIVYVYSTAPDLGTESTSGTDGNYYRTRFRYDDRGRQSRVQAPTGTIYRTVYDGLGRIVSSWVGLDDTPTSGLWSPSNTAGTDLVKTSENVYDHGGVGDGNLTEATQLPGGGAAERVSEFFYDWRNRLVASKSGVQTTESTSTQRPILYVQYDNLDQVVVSEYYDGDGVNIIDANGDGVPDAPAASLRRARTVNSYDEQGRIFRAEVFSVNPSNGTFSGTNRLRSEFWFDQRGNVIKEVQPGGLIRKYQYDGAGRLTTVFLTDGGGESSAWANADDVIGDNVLSQVEYQLDAAGNVLQTTTRERFHDATGTGTLGTPTSGVKARVSYAASYYDLADRLIATVDVGTNGGTAYTRPASPEARSDTRLRTDYVYNSAGWLHDVIDPRGITQRTQYDALGRTIRTIAAYTDGVPSDHDDRTTEYEYDGNGNTLRVRAVLPGGGQQTTQYVYQTRIASGSALNTNDIVSAMQYPDKATGLPSASEQESYTYNALGQLATMTDRNGTTHSYSYDVLGRLIADAVTTLGAGVDGAIRRIETSYDSAGRVFQITSYDAATGGNIVNQVRRQYNGYGQLTVEYQSHNGAVNTATTPRVQYAYSTPSNSLNASRLTRLTYPNGRQLNFSYGGTINGRISRLTDLRETVGGVTTVLESYSYLGLDTVVRRAHPQPGVDLTYIKLPSEPVGDAGDQYTGLDRFGRVVDQRWRNNVTMADLDRFFSTYDRDSNRLTKDNALNPLFDEDYSYDLLNQLASFTRADGHAQSWDLDGQGNFESVTTDGTTQTRQHNAQNQLTQVGGNALTFDRNGNLTTDEQGRKLIWDAWNRLVEVRDSSDATLISYEYDGLGRRIEERPAGGPARDLFYSDSWQVLEERETSGGTSVPRVQYVWSPVYVDALVLRDRDTDNDGVLDERLYVTQDANYNITALFDTSGNIVERYAYDPYGRATILAPDWSERAASLFAWQHLHQGLRFEPLTGLYHNRAREYSPSLMRFVSVDPVWATNLYAAYGNGPGNVTDPSGLFINLALGVVGAGVGAVVGAGVAIYKGGGVRDVVRAAAIGGVTGAVGGLTFGAGLAVGGAIATGAGLTGTAATVAGATTVAISGAAAGQASRATSNVLQRRPLTEGLGRPRDIALDAALSVAAVRVVGGRDAFHQIARPDLAQVRVLNIGGPYNRTLTSRSLRPDFRHVDVRPGPNTVEANVNEFVLSDLFKNVRCLRASNVPFFQGAPGYPYVTPQAFVAQAQQLGVQHIVVTTGPQSAPHIINALRNAGWTVTVRQLGSTRFITARR